MNCLNCLNCGTVLNTDTAQWGLCRECYSYWNAETQNWRARAEVAETRNAALEAECDRLRLERDGWMKASDSAQAEVKRLQADLETCVELAYEINMGDDL